LVHPTTQIVTPMVAWVTSGLYAPGGSGSPAGRRATDPVWLPGAVVLKPTVVAAAAVTVDAVVPSVDRVTVVDDSLSEKTDASPAEMTITSIVIIHHRFHQRLRRLDGGFGGITGDPHQ
jgi:hypothetical protein